MPKSKLIPATWELPSELEARLGDRPGRQRVMHVNGHLLFVVHEPPKPDEPTRKPRLFWRKPDGTWFASGKGNGMVAFQNHLAEFVAVIDHLDQSEDEASTAQDYFNVLDAVGPLRRTAENLHHVLEEARRLVPADRDIINLRDQAYDVSRTAELLYSATKNGMEMIQTRRTEDQANASLQMARASHRLNQFVAFFFPLATLTAVFGMQFVTGLEEWQKPYPFLVVCATGILSGIVMTWIIGSSSRAKK